MSKLAAWTLVGTAFFATGLQAGVNSPPALSDRSSFSELMASLTSAD